MLGNMADLFGKMQEMQQKASELKENLAKQTFSAEAGGGMVKVTVNGTKQVLSIDFNKELVGTEDLDILGDLVVAAVNKAMNEAENNTKNSFGDFTKNLIPGFDPSKLGL
jgi:DNA-binding YbaB/EbfC family protein